MGDNTGRPPWGVYTMLIFSLMSNSLLFIAVVGGLLSNQRHLVEITSLQFKSRDMLTSVQQDMRLVQMRFDLAEQHVRLLERQLELRPPPPPPPWAEEGPRRRGR